MVTVSRKHQKSCTDTRILSHAHLNLVSAKNSSSHVYTRYVASTRRDWTRHGGWYQDQHRSSTETKTSVFSRFTTAILSAIPHLRPRHQISQTKHTTHQLLLSKWLHHAHDALCKYKCSDLQFDIETKNTRDLTRDVDTGDEALNPVNIGRKGQSIYLTPEMSYSFIQSSARVTSSTTKDLCQKIESKTNFSTDSDSLILRQIYITRQDQIQDVPEVIPASLETRPLSRSR